LWEFIAFRIQDRHVEFGSVVNVGKLYQQFLVDCYLMIESKRLAYIRFNHTTIRFDILNGLEEAITRGERYASLVGKRIILLASFTGKVQDKCLTIVKMQWLFVKS